MTVVLDSGVRTGVRNPSDTGTQCPFIVPAVGASLHDLLTDHTAWVQLPAPIPFAARISQVRELTGWSFRDLAEVLGTSHTTVGKLANRGVVTARSQAAADRIEPLLEVLIRLAGALEPGRSLLSVLASPTTYGAYALELLKAGEWSRALLVGLDAARGPRPKRPHLGTDLPKLDATMELH